ncbi:hypothetical protein BKA67DRAFT_538438 [Truncatella angustata]|uniref:Uncharacterized protein n=1 Tax=Truncatella angustata TaxID=152316 RepID=A0A9P8ZV05_9PEZI|nr:uncharacterized protein BKA67DRAFT_538438 [Truncatella angustata]KAH6648399.1 hypothetical protein BKA67DRAFT_538438 [Truncatella angustata]KAH8204836.1 hypothetical protein TruAng_001025 [Truncatella angustata]
MSSVSVPKTPAKARATANGTLQCATPPSTGRKGLPKIVTLKYNPQRMGTFRCNIRNTIQHRRLDYHRLNKILKHPNAPVEATAVAINPFYRGEKLDGSYYTWLLDYFDGDMPDIIRRINKFRGFPQMDDASFNPGSAEEWQARYRTEHYQKEMQRYMPYLEAYWNECGDNFEAHVEFLDSFHVLSDVSTGRLEILHGHEDKHITGPAAKSAHTLSNPPCFTCASSWNEEKDYFIRDIQRNIDDHRYSTIAFMSTIDKHSYGGNLPTGQSVEQSAASGLFVSPYSHRLENESPGLLWTNRPNDNGTEELAQMALNMKTPAMAVIMEPPATAPLDSTSKAPSIPSAMQYHSPAGDLITTHPTSIPDSQDYAQIKTRSDIQTLAVANGFVPSPRNDIGLLPGRIYAEEGGPFPMGALRYVSQPDPFFNHILRSPSILGPVTPLGEAGTAAAAQINEILTSSLHNAPMPQYHDEDVSIKRDQPFSPMVDANVKDRPPTPHPFSNANKRKRAVETMPLTPGLTSAKRRRGNNASKSTRNTRGKCKSKSSRKGKKNESDEDFEFEGDDLNDEEMKIEKYLPSNLRPAGTRRPRPTQGSANTTPTVATFSQGEVAATSVRLETNVTHTQSQTLGAPAQRMDKDEDNSSDLASLPSFYNPKSCFEQDDEEEVDAAAPGTYADVDMMDGDHEEGYDADHREDSPRVGGGLA